MSVRRLILEDDAYDLSINDGKSLPEQFHELLEYGLLAAEQEAFDPIDRAFNNAAFALLSGSEHIHPNWKLTRQYPLSPELLALSQVWHPGGEGPFPVGAKGAPEAIVDLCHLPQATRIKIAERVKAHAELGLRILAVAKGKVNFDNVPEHQHDLDFEFLGLIGLEDPLRSEVPAAIAECKGAGIRVIMITGDHPDTARSIAEQAGLPNPHQVLTGSELASLSYEELGKRIKNTSVCARMMPEQKSRLIDILKAQGEIVAMTGDGINDAPALKKANIGIAMGKRGTDVARESAAIVLLEDDFGSIVNAVKIGRRIYANLQHAMSYLLAVHISIAGLSVIPVLLDMPLILLPVHIAFLHLIIEPACSVAFEAEPEAFDLMRKPPRRPESALFSGAIMLPTLIQGISVLAILLLTYICAWKWGDGATDARTMVFTILVLANIGLIIASLKVDGGNPLQRQGANHALRWVIGASIGLLLLVLYVPPLRELFRFTKLHPVDVLLCLLAGAVSSLWFSLLHRNTASIEA
jgi:Ca2+-transporting ATPase